MFGLEPGLGPWRSQCIDETRSAPRDFHVYDSWKRALEPPRLLALGCGALPRGCFASICLKIVKRPKWVMAQSLPQHCVLAASSICCVCRTHLPETSSSFCRLPSWERIPLNPLILVPKSYSIGCCPSLKACPAMPRPAPSLPNPLLCCGPVCHAPSMLLPPGTDGLSAVRCSVPPHVGPPY